jgi:hypothetical protein
MASGRTIINAIIGAVVGIVLSFIPFSTVVGGAVAGFLEGPDERDGALAGALAGAITFAPIAAFALVVLGFLGFGMGVAAAPVEGFAFVAFVIFVGLSLTLLYTVGLSLLGGYLGAYLAREYPDRHAKTRETIGMGRRDSERGRRPSTGARPRSDPREPFDGDRAERDRSSEPARQDRSERPDADRRDQPGAAESEREDPLRWHEEQESDRDE